MVKNLNIRKNKTEVLEDFQTESPCVNLNELTVDIDNLSEERRNFLFKDIRSQGGALSHLIGKVEVEMNHRVPMAEKWVEGISDYISMESKSFSPSNLSMFNYKEWYLGALLFLFFGFLIGAPYSKVARFAFIICLGIGNLACFMMCLGFIFGGNERFDTLIINMKLAYADLCYVKENDNKPDGDMEDIDGVTAQSGVSPDIMASLLLAVLSFGLGYNPKSTGIITVKEFLRTTPVMKDNMLEIVSSSYVMLNDLMTKIKCEKYLGSILDIPVVDDSIKNWNDRVNEFINSVSNHTDGSHEENMASYDIFIKESRVLEKTLTKGTLSYIMMIDTVKALERCKNNANQRFTSLKGFRPEPVTVIFLGVPGIVKSVLTARFAEMINNVTLPDHLRDDFLQNPHNYIYRKSTDKWWDKYSEKANVTIIDDIFQMVDNGNEPSTSEAAMLIKMTNAEEFAVPMADAQSKNGTYFRSNFILANANNFNKELLNSVHSKDAVRRRLHFYVDCKVDPKYIKNGKTNWDILPHILDVNGEPIPDSGTFPEDFWTFTYVETVGTNFTEKIPISYMELFEKVIERHYKHMMHFEVNKTAAMESMNNMRQSSRQKLDLAKSRFNSIRERLRTKHQVLKHNIKMQMMPGIYPQSGLFPDTDSDSEISADTSSSESLSDQLVENFLDFNNEVRSDLTHRFHRALYLYDPDAVWGKQPLIKFLESLNDYDVVLYNELFKDESMNIPILASKFEHQLYITFDNRIKDDRNPHTGEKKPLMDRFKNMGGTFTNSISSLLDFINRYKFPIVVGAIASASIVYTIHKLIFSLNGKVESQSGNTDRYISRGPSRGKPTGKKVSKDKTNETRIPLSQGGDFQTLLTGATFQTGFKSAQKDVLTAVIDKHHFIMYVHEKKGNDLVSRRLGHCINVIGNIFVMPFHFIFNLEDFLEETKDDSAYITLTTASNAKKCSVTIRQLLKSATYTEESMAADVCIFRAGHEGLSKGAMKFFLKDNKGTWKKRNLIPVTVIGTQQSGDLKEHTTFRVLETSATMIKDGIVIKPTWKTEGSSSRYRLLDTLKYTGDFASGDCGSIICLKQNDLGCAIIAGFHLAGETAVGYGNVITQDLLQDLLDIEDPVVIFEEEIEPQGLTRNPVIKLDYCNPEMIVRGTFEPRASVASCSKTDIVRSVLYNKIPGEIGKVTGKPALLYAKEIDGVFIDPKRIAMKNYARMPIAIEDDVLQQAVQSYFQLIKQSDNVLTEYKTVIDTRTALHSFGDHVKSISSSTSAGWPMNTSMEDDLKKMYYSSLNNNDLELSELAFAQIDLRIKEIENLYRKNIRPVFIYSDALKSEIRPIAKANAGNSRMFSGSPWDYLVMVRKYFGSFIDFFFDKNLNIGSAIGINPYSTDWHDAAMGLLRYSSSDNDLCIGAGDYSKFDSSQTPEILQAIYNIIEAWYGTCDEASDIRFKLWKEITHSRHIFGNEFYEWVNGMPSGNPLTPIINTIYNLLAFRMSWHYTGGEIVLFNKHVWVITLGDDNVFSVSYEYRDMFNELTLVPAMARIGLTYTTEFKGEALVPFRTIKDVEFLKRSFRPIRLRGIVRYIAPIKMETIVSMLYWSKKGSERDQITCDNVSLALRELALHGKNKFEEFYPILRDLREVYLPGVVSHHIYYTDYKSTLYDVLNMEHSL